jgi:hypothetical protein
MAITLSRDAYVEFRCFGMPDEYPKNTREAVNELRRRGYDATESLLHYLVEEKRVALHHEGRWSPDDIDLAAEELAELEAYTTEARVFEYMGVDAEEYFRSLHAAWDKVRDEFGDAATPVNPVPDAFIMHVNPPRFDRDGYVEFTLTDDARRDLELERERTRGMNGFRLPAEERRRSQ